MASAHSELDVLAEVIQAELCMRSLPYLTSLWLQVLNVAGALYASGEGGWPEKGRPAGMASLGRHLLAELSPACSAVPGRQQRQHSAACGEHLSVQAAKLRPWGLMYLHLERRVILCRHPRSELSSTERGRQVRWRLTIIQPGNKGSSAVCSQAAVPSCHGAQVLQGCMRCCPTHRLRCAACISFPAPAASVTFC